MEEMLIINKNICNVHLLVDSWSQVVEEWVRVEDQAKVGKVDQAGGRGCQDQLGNCAWSRGEEVPGAGDNQSGRELRDANEGVAECERWSCTGRVERERKSAPGSENNLCKDPDLGGEQNRQKVSVAGVPRAVRTVGELGCRVVGLAIQGSGFYPEA